MECGTGNASKFGKMSLQESLQAAKKSGSKLHDEINDEDIVPTELGLSIAWQNVPNAKGAWAEWGCEPEDEEDYNRLLLPDRRFYIVGDQVSTLPGWQEGAMMSAEHVVELIAELKEAIVPEGVKPPNSFEVTTR
jgi:monoamine oxidase